MTCVRVAVMAASLLALCAVQAESQQPAHAHGASEEALGTVHFQTSCSSAVAARFDRGVALLHSFEFAASIRVFGDVIAADSTCAMAHWGIALSRWGNPMAAGSRPVSRLQSGQAAVNAASGAGMKATDRERGYIAAVAKLYADHERLDQQTRAVAYERAMADLVAKQPADTEAKIFHALALTASALPTDKTYANQLQAGAILEPIWVRQPNHPGLAHYIIHTYDAPALADKARAAAAAWGARAGRS